MSWNLPGVITTGNPLTQSWLANVNSDFTVLQTQVGLYAAGSAAMGSPPAVGTPAWLVQAGSGVVAFSSGNGSFSYPSPFPNGIHTVQLTNGDATAIGSAFLAMASYSKTTCSLFAVDHTGAGVTGNVRVNWIVYGF